MPFTEYATNALLNILDQSVSGGGAITITGVQVGSGYPTGGDNPLNFTGLKNLVQTLGSITSPSSLSGITSINDLVLYQSTVRFQVSSADAPKTYQFNEYGIFASVGATPPVLILYVTTNGPTGDTITPSGAGIPVIRQKATIIGYSQQATTTTSLTLVNTVDLHAQTHLDNGIDPISVATTARTGSLPQISGKALDVLHGDLSWSPSFMPGFLQLSAAASIPAGWLLCDGSAVSRVTYSVLYAALGGAASPWGQGDGSTSFNVPDLRGRTPIGAGTGPGLSARALGQKGGEENHVLSIAEMPAHTHGVNDPTHAHSLAQNPHVHGVSDPGHAHSVADGGHAHGVYDPGHVHAYPGGPPLSSGTYATMYSLFNQWNNTQPATTGIGIYASGTGIGIYGAGTGISIQGGYASLGVYGAATGISIQNSGSGAGHNTMAPYAVVNYIIHI